MAPNLTRGDYFKDKQEAISYYRAKEDNLKDKPDWMIECIIDFAMQHPNYKEYCEVEARAKSGKKLTAKQEKKYGHLSWERTDTPYHEGQVLYDNVEIHAEGTYDDIAKDPVAREKYNKYNLDFGEAQKPDEHITMRVKTKDGQEYEAKAPIADINEAVDLGLSVQEAGWDVSKVDKEDKTIIM